MTEDEYQCKFYTDSHQEIFRISNEIKELMLSNGKKLENIKTEGKKQVENQVAIVEILKEELKAQTLKL